MGKMQTLQGKHLLEQLACDVCVHLYKSQFEALGKQSLVSISSFVVCCQLSRQNWINQSQALHFGITCRLYLTGMKAAEFFFPLVVLPENTPKVWMAAWKEDFMAAYTINPR